MSDQENISGTGETRSGKQVEVVEPYYRAYGPWLRKKFGGQRVYKVIADAGFTCPNRDGSKGYGGCSYCNVDSFTPSLTRSLPSLKEQLLASMARAKGRFGAEKFIVYFQPNTNTYAPVDQLQSLYDEALAVNPEETVGLSVGTRPDCLDPEKIALLESYADRYAVDLELGMESIHESTLAQINRGCSHAELVRVLESLKGSPMDVCLHMIFGFPWESHEQMLAYAEEVNRHSAVGFVKLHHLHVVKGSILGARYLKEPFPVFSLEKYMEFLADFLPRLRSDIVVQRLFGVAEQDLLIAPDWGMRKAAVQTYLDKELTARGVVQGGAVQS
ncbi:TIGR01212 family radical SAM protein [Oceaniferula marina]|uniref:TIGR01212 family radical SAM protein n=1 Tax=Oceaniferula marina TaxID=2748318 RepID=UPI0029CA75DD|nr:TIGR01212 family radical SAM protein [Oceaniferula marina]